MFFNFVYMQKTGVDIYAAQYSIYTLLSTNVKVSGKREVPISNCPHVRPYRFFACYLLL